MARLIFTPFIVLAFICILALVGGKGRAFNNPSYVYCAYELAEHDSPPPDILFVGMSRSGKGLDPGYMMSRIASRTGKEIAIERLALTFPNYSQFRPVLKRYFARRGSPKHVFLQLSFNFKPGRQRRWDLPINSTRNVSNASLGELLEIREDAKLNAHNTVLPRRFEAGYLSLPALVLQKFVINVYAALRYLPMRLRGKMDICEGDEIYRQAHPGWLYNQLDDTITFHETESQKQNREKNAETARGFLPISPTSAFRRFEADQFNHVIKMLEAAGSTVYLFVMPALGDTDLTPQEAGEIADAFPGNELIHPYSLFETAIGPDLAKSFADTHHATHFGALQYSRYFADVISEMDF